MKKTIVCYIDKPAKIKGSYFKKRESVEELDKYTRVKVPSKWDISIRLVPRPKFESSLLEDWDKKIYEAYRKLLQAKYNEEYTEVLEEDYRICLEIGQTLRKEILDKRDFLN